MPHPWPWISANLAISADGKISSTTRTPSGWTSRADHQRLLDLRLAADALMVGRHTLIADQMTLTKHGVSPQPLRCIVSRHATIPADHPLFHSPGGPIHWLVDDPSDIQIHTDQPLTIHSGGLPRFIESLAHDHGVKHLHCEGGGQLIKMLAEIDALDELHLTLAGHTIFGGTKAPTLTGDVGDFLTKSSTFKLSHFAPNPETNECFLSYRRIR